jgi:ABC-type phosphate transport system substrate-binding protein
LGRSARAAIFGLVLIACASATSAAADVGFKVIVNASVQGKRIQKETLKDIFLRKTVRWGDGSPSQPVDLGLTSPVRIEFIQVVLGYSAAAVQQYWVSQITKGVLPPPVKKSEEEVIAFVAAQPGAIGYVSASTATPETVRLLEIE